MNRLGLFTAVMVIVALPAGVLGEPKDKPIKLKDEKKEKSVPAPAPLVLIAWPPVWPVLLRLREAWSVNYR